MTTFVNTLQATLVGSNLPPVGRPATNMNDGTRLLVDFTDSRCNPNALGALAAGAVLKDLAGGADISAGALSSNNASVVSKGLSWAGGGVTVNTQQIDFGVSHRWNLNARWAVGLWLTRTANSPTGDYRTYLGRSDTVGANSNQSSFRMDSSLTIQGARSTVLPLGVGAAIAVSAAGINAAALTATPHLVVIEFHPGVAIREFLNGSTITRDLGTAVTQLEPFDAGHLRLSIENGGIAHCVVAEQLSVSGRTGAQFAAAEYAARLSQFV